MVLPMYDRLDIHVKIIFLFFENGPFPASCSFIYTIYYNLYKKINVKNIHPVYGAGFRTHDLQDIRILP